MPGGKRIKTCPRCKAPQLNSAKVCKVCNAKMSVEVEVELFAEGAQNDKTHVADVTPIDIQEMNEQMESTPVYENESEAAPKDLNPYVTNDPNEPTLIEKRLGEMLDKVEAALARGFEAPNTLKALISAQEAFEAKDYTLASSHLGGIEDLLKLELADARTDREAPVVAPLKKVKRALREPSPQNDRPPAEAKDPAALEAAIEDLFAPVKDMLEGKPSDRTPSPDRGGARKNEATVTAETTTEAKVETRKNPEEASGPQRPMAKARILRPRPVQAQAKPAEAPTWPKPSEASPGPLPNEAPAKPRQRRTVDLRSVQDDDSGSLSVTKKREGAPKSQGLSMIFLSTEARLALSDGNITLAREKYDQMLAQDPTNKEALDFKARYPAETLTKNLVKNLESQAIEAFLRADYQKAQNLYKEILKASPRHKGALEGVEQCAALLKKEPAK